jgi:hypothetical protein
VFQQQVGRAWENAHAPSVRERLIAARNERQDNEIGAMVSSSKLIFPHRQNSLHEACEGHALPVIECNRHPRCRCLFERTFTKRRSEKHEGLRNLV